MMYIGMDVHQVSTTFCLFDPSAADRRQYRTLTRPTTVEAIRAVLEPYDGCCKVAFEVGTQAQWVAKIVRPLATDVEVANPSRIPWLFRDGRKNDRLDARKFGYTALPGSASHGPPALGGGFGLAGVDQPPSNAGEASHDDQEPGPVDRAYVWLPMSAQELLDACGRGLVTFADL